MTCDPARLAVIPGAYNPPTVAHTAMALHAASLADEVLVVLPESLPHKSFGATDFETRLRLLERAMEEERVSVGSTPGGLFLEIATACAERFPESRISLVCGRDAAERILAWPYDDAATIDRLFSVTELWVYAREGTFDVPAAFRHAIVPFDFDEELQRLSATEVRRRVAAGEDWHALVPPSIHAEVERIYGAPGGQRRGV